MTDQLGQSQVIPYLRGLANRGYDITLLSVEKRERLQKTGAQIRQLLQQYGIGWETIPFSSRPPFLSKLYDQRQLSRKAAALYRQHKFDLLHCRSYVAAESGLYVSKKYGVPFLFDMRGFWVDERVDSGLWKLNNPLYRLLYRHYKKKEKKYFASSAHVISLTEKGKEELVGSYHLSGSKISVIPCCADLQHFDFHLHSNEEGRLLKEALDIPPGAKVLSYLGSLGGWYLTDEMIRFFKALKKQYRDAVFLLITNDKPSMVAERMQQFGLTGQDFRVKAASRNEVPSYLYISDWNIFFIKDAYSKKASSPTKQGEVMAMGIPVICNDIGDTGKIVRNSKAGIVIDAFTEEDYNKAIRILPERSAVLSESIRRAACQYYDLANGVSKYEEVYKKLLDS
jgi:glycosyltransferase involved in cell wall biosynthesis